MSELEYPKVEKEIFDVDNENLQKLASLFPGAVKDGQLDIDAIKEELGQFEEVGPEKYELSWAGKQNAKKEARKNLLGKTLKFCSNDSKESETTENLYIEGDNLEALKLLKKNYYGAIKLIYIDPPYNTGEDFVYRDNFAMSQKDSDLAEGNVSEEGERLVINNKGTNRFHANWLNMIYPRLKIAKDLLMDEGVIFISIGEEEYHNLKEIMNEIFGENNHRNTFILRRYDKNLNKQFVENGLNSFNIGYEYILCYSKQENFKFNPVYKESSEKRQNVGYWKGFWNDADRKTMRYDLLGFTPENGQWKWQESRAKIAVDNYKKYLSEFKDKMTLEEYWESTGKQLEFIKRNPNGQGKNKGVEHWIAPSDGSLRNTNWTDILASRKESDLDIPFDFPKNIDFIKEILKASYDDGDIILDFFSGSSSTAHSIMDLNAEDHANRRFIMIQFPENLDENLNKVTGDAKKSIQNAIDFLNKIGKPHYLTELGKERIRRAGDKIKKSKDQQLKIGEEPKEIPDIGFKVFRVEDTTLNWEKMALQGKNLASDYLPNTTDKDKLDFTPGFNDFDVVYEIMLRQDGLPLTSKIETLTDMGSRTYLVADSYLISLEENINAEMVDKLSRIEPLPFKFVFRDSAFNDDIALKDETFRRLNALIDKNKGGKKQAYTVEFI